MLFNRIARAQALLGQQSMKRLMSTAAHEHKHEPNPEFWKKVFYFVSCPAIALGLVNTYFLEKEHYEHYHREKFIPYEHLRIRRKRFPWGDGNHSLFHNPKTNPLPEGWEDDEH